MSSEASSAEIVKAPAAPAQGRRLGLAMLVVLVLCVICGPFFIDRLDRDAPRLQAGEVSYAKWGPLKAPVALEGQWRATVLAGPAAGTSLWLKAPGPWEGARAGGRTLSESEAVAYRAKIHGLPADRYLLFIPKTYAAQQVLVNGKIIGRMGQFGLNRETSRYLGRGQEVVIDTDGGDIDLQINLSTFHHRENGFPEAPVLGLVEPMSHWILLDWIRSLLLSASLLLLGCLAAVIFVFRPQDKTSFYLALGCVTLLPLAATMSHDNLIAVGLPGLSFEFMVSFQLLSTTAALSTAMAYANELFPRESPRLPYLVIQGLNAARFVLYLGLAVSDHVITLSKWSAAAAPFRIVVLAYVLGVVIFACIRKRDGAGLFLFGLAAMIGTIVYTDVTTNLGLARVANVNLLPIGMLLLLFSQLVLVAERWAIAIGTEAQANSDLRRLLDVNISITSEMELDTLLKKVVEVTSKVIRADRSSLFLYDEKRRELWSAVAEGIDTRPIRFPTSEGVAGWVYTHGEAVNLADAYADPRFNRDVDARTGYRTKSVLTVPITARDGRRLGVMQALNSLDGQPFDDADQERMCAFAAQAAVAIDNARLFADVAAERNYNESILRSMSSGVVTLDREVKTAKLNAAAARILEAPVTSLQGVDVRAWLAASNPAMLAEIDSVAKGGRPKTLLDADIRTARGETVSANISIVPLLGEKGPVGLLILIEDISEGKRMQAAMRRFMSQEVVDQVLDHGDKELLFGTACRASVLFADIRNFTSLAETLQPRQTVDMLNEIFAELVEAVDANDGVLDKFLGDAIMAVYGAPLPSGRDAQNAVESAIAMMDMVTDLNKRRRRRGREELRLGLGIATGDVVAGTIGSLKRMDYTVIGDSVNLASRLQQLTKYYQVDVIICETTATELGAAFPLRELDTLRVRGRQQPAKLFQVLTGDPAKWSPALDAYGRGRDLLDRRRWEEAVAAFEEAVAADPNDRPSALMLERAQSLISRPPAADWDGVWGIADAA